MSFLLECPLVISLKRFYLMKRMVKMTICTWRETVRVLERTELSCRNVDIQGWTVNRLKWTMSEKF